MSSQHLRLQLQLQLEPTLLITFASASIELSSETILHMNLRRIAPLLAFPLIVVGCATNPAEDSVKQDPQQAKVTCEHTYRVGSMMPTKECAPPLSEGDRQRLEAGIREMTRPSGVTAPGK